MFQGTTVTGTLVIVSRVTVGIIISIGRQIEYCFKWKELLNVRVQSNRAALVHEMQHFHLQVNICIQTYQILLKDKTMTKHSSSGQYPRLNHRRHNLFFYVSILIRKCTLATICTSYMMWCSGMTGLP